MTDRIDWLRTSGVSVLIGNATLAPELDRAQLLANGQRVVDPCRYEATARAAAMRTDRLAGYPLSTVTAGLFYDAETLDAWGVEPPGTVAELATLAERAHDPDAGTYGVAAALDAFALSGYARAYGADIYDAETESLGIEDADLRRGLAAVVEAIAPYLPPELDRGSQLSAFRSGETPFYLGPSSALAELTERDGPVGAVPMPTPAGGTPRPYATTTCCYVLDTDTESEADVTASEQFGA
nr:extracellular solute-binding protein [Halapricum sp. CBA1109]